MRLLLDYEDSDNPLPPDIWVSFVHTTTFAPAAYINKQYDTVDAYIVGAGGGGGGGGVGNGGSQPSTHHGGGGGGAGGGGGIRIITGLDLSNFLTAEPITIGEIGYGGDGGATTNGAGSPGTFGGNSVFKGFTAYGGGGGGGGGVGTPSDTGGGGGGGAGGGRNSRGLNGGNGRTAPTVAANGGLNSSGGGAGGAGGYVATNHVGEDGGNGLSYLNEFDCGGGGGGGGGHGTISLDDVTTATRYAKAGDGGQGFNQSQPGGYDQNFYLESTFDDSSHISWWIGGLAGKGAGGANLTDLTGQPNLTGHGGGNYPPEKYYGLASVPGGSGRGGNGGSFVTQGDPGCNGAFGGILLRIYQKTDD